MARPYKRYVQFVRQRREILPCLCSKFSPALLWWIYLSAAQPNLEYEAEDQQLNESNSRRHSATGTKTYTTAVHTWLSHFNLILQILIPACPKILLVHSSLLTYLPAHATVSGNLFNLYLSWTKNVSHASFAKTNHYIIMETLILPMYKRQILSVFSRATLNTISNSLSTHFTTCSLDLLFAFNPSLL